VKRKRTGSVSQLVDSMSGSNLKIAHRESSDLGRVMVSGTMSDHREISKKFLELIDNKHGIR
jgi:hypothetical protein